MRKGLKIERLQVFPSKVDVTYITRQLKWAKSEAKAVPASSLSTTLLNHIEALQQAASIDNNLVSGTVTIGGSYCLVAKK